MAISVTTEMPNSFKVETLQALHNFTASTGHTFKIALIAGAASGTATYGASTTNYSDLTTETSGTGYTAGGNTLTSVTPALSSSTAVCDFADTTWSSATFTASGALIYNTNSSNRAVAVISFSGDKSVSSGDFTVQFPVADEANAIIRIA